MIAGLESTTSGSIQIDGRDVGRVTPRNRNLAMVFQDNALYPHMTVRDNMAFGLKNRGATSDQIGSQIDDVSQQLQIRDILSRLPDEISGGQQQRVALARAMVQQPAIYLFDEPLSDLDADLRTKLRTEIKRLHQRLGRTMIYVTHDQTEAMTLADRIVVLKDGRVQQVATPHDLYSEPSNQFVATFIGSPPMNFFTGELIVETDKSEFISDSVRISMPNLSAGTSPGRMVLGVRPEHIGIDDPNSKTPATIELVEFAGESTFVHLSVDSTKFVARVRTSTSTNTNMVPAILGNDRIGTTTNVRFDTSALHWFDETTGERLVRT